MKGEISYPKMSYSRSIVLSVCNDNLPLVDINSFPHSGSFGTGTLDPL